MFTDCFMEISFHSLEPARCIISNRDDFFEDKNRWNVIINVKVELARDKTLMIKKKQFICLLPSRFYLPVNSTFTFLITFHLFFWGFLIQQIIYITNDMIWFVLKAILYRITFRNSIAIITCTFMRVLLCYTNWMFCPYFRLWLLLIFIFLVQVRLRTEVLRTPHSTRPGFELITSRLAYSSLGPRENVPVF